MTAARTTAASTGCGRLRSRPEANSTTNSVNSAAIRPDSGVRAWALSLTSDCDMPPLTGKPRPRPADRFESPIASSSWFGSNRWPCFCPNIRPIADVSTVASTNAASAAGRSRRRSERETSGSPIAGSPCGTLPRSATPFASRSNIAAAAIPPTTTTNGTGRLRRRQRPARSSPSAVSPTISAVRRVSPRWERKYPDRCQKSPCVPVKPNNFGSWVLAR